MKSCFDSKSSSHCCKSRWKNVVLIFHPQQTCVFISRIIQPCKNFSRYEWNSSIRTAAAVLQLQQISFSQAASKSFNRAKYVCSFQYYKPLELIPMSFSMILCFQISLSFLKKEKMSIFTYCHFSKISQFRFTSSVNLIHHCCCAFQPHLRSAAPFHSKRFQKKKSFLLLMSFFINLHNI